MAVFRSRQKPQGPPVKRSTYMQTGWDVVGPDGLARDAYHAGRQGNRGRLKSLSTSASDAARAYYPRQSGRVRGPVREGNRAVAAGTFRAVVAAAGAVGSMVGRLVGEPRVRPGAPNPSSGPNPSGQPVSGGVVAAKTRGHGTP